MQRLLALSLALLLAPFVGRADFPAPTGPDAARTFPYSMVGQLTFSSGGQTYVGTGSVVQPRGVLTAGHNLYDSFGGWSVNLVFKRGHYNGEDLATRRPQRIFVLAGYQANVDRFGGDSLAAFAKDTGGLLFGRNVANGGHLGWTTDASVLTNETRKLALGYGADSHTGEVLLAVQSPRPFRQVYGQFYEGAGTGIEGGMSGGPLLCTTGNGLQVVCGTVVSGSDYPVSGGIRAINNGVSAFILTYLATPTSR